MKFKILVTDVTRYGTLYCVAGWDLERGCMVRPEPTSANHHDESSKFWGGAVAGPGQVLDARGIVTFEADLPPAAFPYPHASEDRIVVKGGSMHSLGVASIGEMRQAVSGGLSGSVRAAFDGGLQRWNNGKASVPEGHKGRSLGAIEVPANRLTIFEDTSRSGKRQLRGRLEDREHMYDLSVTSDELRAKWIASDAATVRKYVHSLGSIHVRVGLARAFETYGCLLQVNGVYGY